MWIKAKESHDAHRSMHSPKGGQPTTLSPGKPTGKDSGGRGSALHVFHVAL